MAFNVKFTVTPLGGDARRGVAKIVDAILRYLQPQTQRPQTPSTGAPSPGAGTPADPTAYYADSGEEPGRWLGRGATALGLTGEVATEDFGAVLAGRNPQSGARLITAQGSAGRRPRLGVGNRTQIGPDGEALYDARDAAAVLELPIKHVQRMLDVGTALALARAIPTPAMILDQPEASYLVPLVDGDGNRWITEAELARCEEHLHLGTPGEAVSAAGRPEDLLPLTEAAQLAGLTPRYVRRLAQRYQNNSVSIDASIATDQPPRHAYLPAEKDDQGHWHIRRSDLVAYLQRREPPAMRVAFDLTLTTEKSLGVLALLSETATQDVVLDAILTGNDWALDWLEGNAAAARADDKVVAVRGWTVASFRHHTSRALDPFPHHHNVVANTVEDHHGIRRALDAYRIYIHAKEASALATAEMRYQLTTRLGVRWRPGHNGGWEIAGIPDEVLHEFSQRRNEIEHALRELEEALGRGAHPDAVARIALATRPAKLRARLEELLKDWWRRAEALGFTASDLAACTNRAPSVQLLQPDELFELLASRDGGICQNVSVFHRGDVLTALANLPIPGSGEDDPQPLIVPADELERLADAFLGSSFIEEIAPASDDAPACYATREILAVQGRIVARYRDGLHSGQALAAAAVVERTLAQHAHLTDEQTDLVRTFCTSGHAIQCAIGRAGTGKTTTMAAAADVWTASGWRVLGTAVKGEAARTLAVTTGIATETLAWYLVHEDPLTGPLDARTVLVVDEASTISDRDLDHLGWLADQTGATLRLIGDPAQHGAVEAGGMFRVLCERYPGHTPELIQTHRLRHPLDLAAADALRAGQITQALGHLEAAGHLHVVDDDFQIYVELLDRWWKAHQAGQGHPIVTRDNHTRRQLNRLTHILLRANDEIGADEILATEDRRFAVGDRVIARAPNRQLHTGDRQAYIRNGASGTVVARQRGWHHPDGDQLLVEFDEIGIIDVPRSFFDQHEISPGHHDVGIDHAYAVTSYAVQGATHPTSTSRIDPTSSRAEAYVDITRGVEANYLYLTHPDDPLDGELLPRTPPDPIEEDVTRRLENSIGEQAAWEIRQNAMDRASAQGLDLGL